MIEKRAKKSSRDGPATPPAGSGLHRARVEMMEHWNPGMAAGGCHFCSSTGPLFDTLGSLVVDGHHTSCS